MRQNVRIQDAMLLVSTAGATPNVNSGQGMGASCFRDPGRSRETWGSCLHTEDQNCRSALPLRRNPRLQARPLASHPPGLCLTCTPSAVVGAWYRHVNGGGSALCLRLGTLGVRALDRAGATGQGECEAGGLSTVPALHLLCGCLGGIGMAIPLKLDGLGALEGFVECGDGESEDSGLSVDC